MKDIILFDKSKGDSKIVDTDLYKAENLLSVQIGEMQYLPDFGIDLNYFMSPDVQIENTVFTNYLQQKITSWFMNVIDMRTTLDTFVEKVKITLAASENTNVVIGEQ